MQDEIPTSISHNPIFQSSTIQAKIKRIKEWNNESGTNTTEVSKTTMSTS
jgi:hypothetical protein